MEFDLVDLGRETACPHCGVTIKLVPAGVFNRALAGALRWLNWQRFGAFLAGAAVVFVVAVALHEPRWKRIDPSQLDAEMKERTIQAGRVIDKKPLNQYWLTAREFNEYRAIIRLEIDGLKEYKPELWKKAWAKREKLVDSLLSPAGKFAFDMPHSDRMLSEQLHQLELQSAGLSATR